MKIEWVESPLTLRQKLRRVDWLGSLSLVIFVGGLLAGLSLKAAEDLPWQHPFVWVSLIASGAALVAFVFVEARVAPEPVMPITLLLSRTPFSVALTNLSVSLFTNAPLLISYFQIWLNGQLFAPV